MKVLFPFLLAAVFVLPAYAHPGKTDRDGGHKCYKECAEWDLYYAEYHMHDKDGKAVKVARKKTVRRKPAKEPVEGKAVISADSPAEAAPSQPAAAAALVEPGVPFLPWILLMLFLLLFFVVRRNRKKTSGAKQAAAGR
jgi:hypothetical protein